MKNIEQQQKKVFDSEFKKLLSVLPLLKLNDKRRQYILQQISIIKKIQKIDQPTQIQVTSGVEAPLQQFFKQQKNEEVAKKEKQRGKYSKI